MKDQGGVRNPRNESSDQPGLKKTAVARIGNVDETPQCFETATWLRLGLGSHARIAAEPHWRRCEHFPAFYRNFHNPPLFVPHIVEESVFVPGGAMVHGFLWSFI